MRIVQREPGSIGLDCAASILQRSDAAQADAHATEGNVIAFNCVSNAARHGMGPEFAGGNRLRLRELMRWISPGYPDQFSAEITKTSAVGGRPYRQRNV